MTASIFDKIIAGEIPADIVHDDDISLAFRDINPQAPVHVLIIPKKRIATMNDIQVTDREVVGHLYIVAAKLAQQFGIADSGYRVVMNCNADGGQSVYHIHLHLLGGMTMGWPPFANHLPKVN
jgi:histidine triad (HIT) family protein